MLSTVSALGAQCVGAGDVKRANDTLRDAVIIAACFGTVISAIVQFIAEPSVALFTTDAAVAASGALYLRGYIFDCIFAGIHFSFSGYFCALGKSWISFLHNITAIVLVRIPGAYLMSRLFTDTLMPMGLSTAAASFLSVLICVAAFALLERHRRLDSCSRP